MSLVGAPLLYVFYDICRLTEQRALLETAMALPVIEVEPHQPHHRHGVVKYDAGNLILSLNLSTVGKFRADASDALTTVFEVDQPAPLRERLQRHTGMTAAPGDGRFTDADGHHYAVLEAPAGRHRPVVGELRLTVADLAESVEFYGERLGLDPLESPEGTARFATGTVPLVLLPGEVAPDGRRPRRSTYLLVFHAGDIEEAHAALVDRGVAFGSRRVAFSEIGGTARFDDPSGHRFCLYEPSAESLTWGSGEKVMNVVAGSPVAS
jgi:predicted enzyme related to lactoylglutathione lyase